MKKRANGKGSAIYLGDNRDKPWGARITIGKDINGVAIRHFIDTFKTQLEALVCLENYHNNPYPLYIKDDKYNRIVTFPINPYPIVATQNPRKAILEKIKKDNYTFKQLFEDFKRIKCPTYEEIQKERIYHIKPKGKLSYNYYMTLQTAFNYCKDLYDIVYKDLRTSDFQEFINNSDKGNTSLAQILNLFKKLDAFAIEQGIIDKSFSQFVTFSKEKEKTTRKPFTYEQIQYLWNISPKNKNEDFVRDFLLIALYTGARAEEILSLYTKNIFLDKNYIIGGIKTSAGKDRIIPIHHKIKPIILKYYNKQNEFLFMNEKQTSRKTYRSYLKNYTYSFIENHPFLEHRTAHECRHTLLTELKKINIKDYIINAIIGHSNGNVGEDVYTHISIDELIESIENITYENTKKLYIFASNH